jgi:ribosomal-protein-alanine N-acetyltransferase
MVSIVPLTCEYLDEVFEIEEDSFSIPWSKAELARELTENKLGIYIVALEDGHAVGYAGMWHVVNEGHITNVAVRPSHRRRGIGDMLIKALDDIAAEKEMIGLTLEVRMGNAAAHKLYAKHGYKVEGIRKNYYADTKEDAVIMWKYFI